MRLFRFFVARPGPLAADPATLAPVAPEADRGLDVGIRVPESG
jgi:hypothetical protein